MAVKLEIGLHLVQIYLLAINEYHTKKLFIITEYKDNFVPDIMVYVLLFTSNVVINIHNVNVVGDSVFSK